MRNKVILTFWAIIFSHLMGFSQPGRYFISFTDKDNSNYSLDNPEEFLSERAIERRQKYNIPLDITDLPVCEEYIDSIEMIGVRVLNTSKWFNAVTVEITDMLFEVDTFMSFSFVKDISRTKTLKSNKLAFDYEYDNTGAEAYGNTHYGKAWWQIAQLKGHLLHNSGYRGKGVLVAVLDAGFYRVDSLPAFDSLWANNQILAYRDFVHDGGQFFRNSYHGMKVFSIISGNVPGQYVGTAPDADFILCRTEDANTEFVVEEDNWVAGLEFADSLGADIINSSLGYNDFDDTLQNHSYEDLDGNTTRISIAADIASAKGMLVVTSAGNEGAKSWQYITAPADADSILTAGAVDSAGVYASFSSKGPTYDRRIKPNVATMGQLAQVQYASGNFGPGSGTSYSSPVLAGMVACLWQANPDASNMEVIRAIEQSASQYNYPDSLIGYGVPDFRIADLILKSKSGNPIDTSSYLHLYPNPFRDYLNIEICTPRGEKVSIQVFDTLGKKVHVERKIIHEQLVTRLNVDLSHLDNGIYIVKLISGDVIRQKKIIKDL